MSQSDFDDDPPQLSAETFLALQEFYTEQSAKEALLQSREQDEVDEDWQLSQFWYDDQTVNTLVKVAMQQVCPNGKIALVSCPTLFNSLKRAVSNCEVKLFEYDSRFSKVCEADFIPYDYKSPLDVPKQYANYFDLVIADPPFLSEDCLAKTAVTIKFLTQREIVLCTGEVMSGLAERLLNVKRCVFRPSHKNNLANEFCCYSNFNLDSLV